MLYFPTIGELAWLVFSCLLVCGLGYLAILPFWRTRDALPVWYSLALGIGALLIYSVCTVSMIQRVQESTPQSLAYVRDVLDLESQPTPVAETEPDEESVLVQEQNARARLIMLLGWTVAFWIPPAIFFGRLFLNSVATQTVRAVPFSDAAVGLHEQIEFKVAKALHEKGDIRGALRVYRNYPENRQRAWMEAGKMLEAESLLVDAEEHYRDMIDLFGPSAKCWPEATYRLAKVIEARGEKASDARDLLMAVYQRAPRSEFGHMAEASLQGLQVSSEDLLAQLDAGFEAVKSVDGTGQSTKPA